jgi:hypothetical protein
MAKHGKGHIDAPWKNFHIKISVYGTNKKIYSE